MQLVSFSHSYGQCMCQIVIVTYRRRRVFGIPGMKEHMERVFSRLFEQKKFVVRTLKVKPDHVHIYMGVPPTLSISQLFQTLKGLSAYMLFKELPGLREHLGGRLWSRGKMFESVGAVTEDIMIHYIENQ